MDLKSKLLAIAIGIVLVFFVFYGIETFYPEPKWGDFCDSPRAPKFIQDEATCAEQGGKWTPQTVRCVTEPCPQGFCDADYKCRGDYEEVKKIYDKNVFIAGLIIGALLFIGGYALAQEAVGAGILGGSILTLFVTLTRYWGHLHDIWRFIILGVILAALIWVGYKWTKPKKRK
ncbi:MAG: hypothetical protein ACE5FT_02165 [Candidatus Nanoarchaeia archaeon]